MGRDADASGTSAPRPSTSGFYTRAGWAPPASSPTDRVWGLRPPDDPWCVSSVSRSRVTGRSWSGPRDRVAPRSGASQARIPPSALRDPGIGARSDTCARQGAGLSSPGASVLSAPGTLRDCLLAHPAPTWNALCVRRRGPSRLAADGNDTSSALAGAGALVAGVDGPARRDRRWGAVLRTANGPSGRTTQGARPAPPPSPRTKGASR